MLIRTRALRENERCEGEKELWKGRKKKKKDYPKRKIKKNTTWNMTRSKTSLGKLGSMESRHTPSLLASFLPSFFFFGDRPVKTRRGGHMLFSERKVNQLIMIKATVKREKVKWIKSEKLEKKTRTHKLMTLSYRLFYFSLFPFTSSWNLFIV